MARQNHEITRIYQGKVVNGYFINQAKGEKPPTDNVLSALKDTHVLFQDAVNYHLVALAGMAQMDDQSICGQFRTQVKALWNMPESYLKKSLCRTFGLSSKDVSFDDMVKDYIFAGCERSDVLKEVLKYISGETKKGDIQQTGREIFPMLCKADYDGNFDYNAWE